MSRALTIGVLLAMVSACSSTHYPGLYNKNSGNTSYTKNPQISDAIIQKHIDLNKHLEYLINNGNIKDVEDYYRQINTIDTFVPLFENHNGYLFQKVLNATITQRTSSFFAYIKAVIDGGGQWKYLKIVQAEKRPFTITISALIRLTSSTGHIEYLYTNYSYLIEIKQHLFDFAFLDSLPPLRKQIIDDTNLRITNRPSSLDPQSFTPSYIQFLLIANGKDFKSALNIYNQFPADYQNQPVVISTLLNLAWQKNNKDDILSVWNILEKIEDDTKFIDYRIYFSRKLRKYERCFSLIDHYEALIGNDAGFMLQRAAVSLDNNDTDKTLQLLKIAISQDNDYLNAYHFLYEILLERERYDDLSTLLDIYAVKFNYVFDQKYFKTDEKLKKFSQSKVYAEWVKKYPEDLNQK